MRETAPIMDYQNYSTVATSEVDVYPSTSANNTFPNTMNGICRFPLVGRFHQIIAKDNAFNNVAGVTYQSNLYPEGTLCDYTTYD